MRLAEFCFLFASVAALIGVSLGIYMGLAEDHTLMPVHAHTNLVGWASIFLFGLYYRAHPEAVDKLARVQVGAVALGIVAMMIGLGVYLTNGSNLAFPAVVVGSILIWVGMACFVAVIWRTGFAVARLSDSTLIPEQRAG